MPPVDRPHVTIAYAQTLDGRLATRTGSSQWISGPESLRLAHALRASHDAVMVGIGTVLADDPWLSCRIRGGRDPIRIVLDGQLRTPPDARLLPRRKGPRTIIATTARASEARERALVRAGAEVWRLPAHRSGRVRLHDLARRLGEAGLTSVLVEGGGEVHASFLEARLADELILYLAPKVVGGPAPSWVGGDGLASLAAAYRFELAGEPVRVGEDLRVRAVRAQP